MAKVIAERTSKTFFNKTRAVRSKIDYMIEADFPGMVGHF